MVQVNSHAICTLDADSKVHSKNAPEIGDWISIDACPSGAC